MTKPSGKPDAASATQVLIGIETEFGIKVTGPTDVNPVVASSLVVGAHRDAAEAAVDRWDHSDESPLRDARGFDAEAPGESAPDELTGEDLGLANSVLTNGARLYVDHAHPEYSSPEVTNARDAVIWDKAGERIAERAADVAASRLAAGAQVLIHKNNTDGKGQAYGTHENYLVPRAVPFGQLVSTLTPHFVTRAVYTGAGRIGSEFSGVDWHEDIPFQLTQRADFFEVEVGLETTLKRPIINTRDEPHADPTRFRRLHVINGDANMSEVATYLKVGVTQLILRALVDGHLTDVPQLRDPVRAFHAVSHDRTQRRTVERVDGETIGPLAMQGMYLEAVKDWAKDVDTSSIDDDIIARWEAVLTTAEDDPLDLAGTADWATKFEMLTGYADRHKIDWGSGKLRMIDLQYHDVRQDKGLYNRAVASGRIERLVSEDDVERAMVHPPGDTRAYFRGECVRRFGDKIVAAGWDALIFDAGEQSLQRVPMMDPTRGTRATTQALLDSVSNVPELLRALRG